jgi:hypothetical protein
MAPAFDFIRRWRERLGLAAVAEWEVRQGAILKNSELLGNDVFGTNLIIR